MRSFRPAIAAVLLAACSSADIGAPSAGGEAGVRTEPVVAGRPARVFVMAGLGDKCQALAAPVISIDTPPGKGDVSFVPGQETTIKTSLTSAACVGKNATGTGIYYTARAGQTGSDTFAITAKLGSGEIAKRSFQVTIVE